MSSKKYGKTKIDFPFRRILAANRILWYTEGKLKEGHPMKCYETVWEIFNKCSNNQMRDVFIEEVETDDTDEYVRNKMHDKSLTWEKQVMADGTVIYDIFTTGMRERISFTPV